MSKRFFSTIKWPGMLWGGVPKNETVCLCRHCKVTVHDLSNMTDEQIAQAVENNLLRRQIKQRRTGNLFAEIIGSLDLDVPSTETISRANRVLSAYLGVMFLIYCATFLWACPKPDLACAVCAELIVFTISIFLILASAFRFRSKLPRSPRWASGCLSGLKRSVAIFENIKLAVLAILVILVTVDFSAFATAAFGNTPLTVALYCIPGSQLVGFHPAATLEVLAGAYVEHKEFARAEKLYMDILNVRIRVFGAVSGPVGALYSDLADLNVRQNKFDKAEYWYRKSIALSQAPGGPAPTGRALTGLATVLRQSGRLEESEQYYLKALSVRAQLYGTNSRQYHDTQRAYQQLLCLKRQKKPSTE
ncbi:MAG: hypothetical protein C5B53_11275 [Candidatus Melainabacteria bacterium]|nr:MAG: hypothetical protein C5B53_11275 [Candidatus Melainabacteria bacterium]